MFDCCQHSICGSRGLSNRLYHVSLVALLSFFSRVLEHTFTGERQIAFYPCLGSAFVYSGADSSTPFQLAYPLVKFKFPKDTVSPWLMHL